MSTYVNDLRGKSLEELHTDLLSLRRDQFNLRLLKATHSLEKPHIITIKRKQIAQIKTIMQEKMGEAHDK